MSKTTAKAKKRGYPKRKDFKPIALELPHSECAAMRMIGRFPDHQPYISITAGGIVPDKDIRRLRDWCEEILVARKVT